MPSAFHERMLDILLYGKYSTGFCVACILHNELLIAGVVSFEVSSIYSVVVKRQKTFGCVPEHSKTVEKTIIMEF